MAVIETPPELKGGPLRESDYEALEKSWINRETATSALLRRVENVDGAEIVGKKSSEGDFAGVVIPYLWPGVDPVTKALGLEGRKISLYRLRRDRPEIRIEADGARREAQKYMAAPGSSNRLYFHPETPPEWLSDESLPIVITEGEKKGLALWRLAWWNQSDAHETARFLPIALSGAWNWRGKVGKQDAPNGGKQDVKGPIADIAGIEWQNRRVVILFDGNVKTNDSVKKARLDLARHLFYTCHAQVYFADLPTTAAEAGINGIDDFLAAKGPEKALKLIESAREKRFKGTLEEDASSLDKDDRITKILEPCQFIQTPNHQLYVSLEVNGHRETMGLKTRPFKSWIARQVRAVDGKATNIQGVNEMIAFAESEADAAPASTPVPLRLASDGDTIYVDMANERWEAIEIDAKGYRPVIDFPIRFRRARTMSAQVSPLQGGSLDLLKKWCNCQSRETFVLLCAWLVGALAPTGPYPVINLRGEQGSAKSTTSKILRLLVDPAGRPENYYSGAIKSMPREERDLMISAQNSWVLVFDNTSGIHPQMSDCLCRLSTGGSFSTRQLHSDDEEMVFEAMRPLILNGIDDMATMPDLVDRSLMIDLPAIPEAGRRAESEFWREFEGERPLIVGALYYAISKALKHGPDVHLERTPRMADFAKWVVGACRGGGLPFSEDEFLEVYSRNRADATAAAIEASPLTTHMERMVRERGRWEGTAAELLEDLNKRVGDGTRNSKQWPKDVRSIGNRIRRVLPLLRASGITFENFRSGKGGSRIMVFEIPLANIPVQGNVVS